MALKEYLLSLATDERRGFLASAVKFPLFLLSLVYSSAVVSLSAFYRFKPYRSGIKVISVGNITLGGTGKTVLVEHLARILAGSGRRVAVLSRGYMRPAGKDKGEDGYADLGDEAGMLRNKLPGILVLAGPDRVSLLKSAAARGAEAVILDDGFQQWRIAKDLDIVCVDCRGFGNACLIPRGTLREPLSALARADMFILTNSGLADPRRAVRLKEQLSKLNPRALIVESDHGPAGLYGADSAEKVELRITGRACLVCGIGNPESFFNSCLLAGIAPGLKMAFPDHHRYSQKDIDLIASACAREGIRSVISTEKDRMRLSAGRLKARGLTLYVLKVALRIKSNEQELSRRLFGLFAA